ncbi:MAG: hypothetical protein NC453_26145 [Muribaculum sp.]|nr:hypothetical protein [Muribaculum sp.]
MKSNPRIASMALSFILSFTAFATNNVCSVFMSKVYVTEEPDEPKIHPHRHRVPICPVECLIDVENGISFVSSSLSSSDIIAYEIYDYAAEKCLMSFSDEDAFVENLFNLTGDYQLRFIAEDYELIGYISL